MPPEEIQDAEKDVDLEERYVLDHEDPARVATAISTCLRHLYRDARKIGLNFTAHLIAVADFSIPYGRNRRTNQDNEQ